MPTPPSCSSFHGWITLAGVCFWVCLPTILGNEWRPSRLWRIRTSWTSTWCLPLASTSLPVSLPLLQGMPWRPMCLHFFKCRSNVYMSAAIGFSCSHHTLLWKCIFYFDSSSQPLPLHGPISKPFSLPEHVPLHSLLSFLFFLVLIVLLLFR